MKKYSCFFIVVLIFSTVSVGYAATFSNQVQALGSNRYSILITSDTPQQFDVLTNVLEQKAQEVCGGAYSFIKLHQESSRDVTGIIECRASQPQRQITPAPERTTNRGYTSRQPAEQQRWTQPQRQTGTKHLGVGIQANFFNLGIGPNLEFWLTDSLGIEASLGAMFDWVSYVVRGNYVLNIPLFVAGEPTRPYVGAGFAYVEVTDEDVAGIKLEQNGSGAQIYAGILHPATYIHPNLYLRGEFIYSAFELDTEASTTTEYGTHLSVEREDDWGLFSLGAVVTFRF